MSKGKKIVYGIIVLFAIASGVFIWNNYQIEISERPIKPIWPLTPSAELTVIVTDAKTEKPIEGAIVEVKEMVSCPAMEGYPCPQGLIWQTKTNKQGQALFNGQSLKEFITKEMAEFSYVNLALDISARGYQNESKEILYSPDKELIKRDFGISPPGDQRIIYNPKEKVFSVEMLRLDSSQSPPGDSSSYEPSDKKQAEVTPDKVVELKTYNSGNFTLKYPLNWKVSTRQIEYYDFPTLELTKIDGTKMAGGYEFPEIWIGSFEIYSTSGAICANEPECPKTDTISFTIKNKKYSTDVFRRQVWESGKFTGKYFYVFQLGSQSELDSIPSKPTITGQYSTVSEKAEIENILSSINY